MQELPATTDKAFHQSEKHEKTLMILTGALQNQMSAELGENWGLNKHVGGGEIPDDCDTSPFKVLLILLFSIPGSNQGPKRRTTE